MLLRSGTVSSATLIRILMCSRQNWSCVIPAAAELVQTTPNSPTGGTGKGPYRGVKGALKGPYW